MARHRDFDALSEAQVAAGRTAKRSVTADAQFRPAGTKSMAELLDTIQLIAEAATGERSFLHVDPSRDRR
ncbi:hypothetical protein [Methylobacterium gnaphalii]|uniref:Uncharacterized protein n=1 Tax=Methylobacterium gnaphalii TaxID=1010610 RepID=A0A512JI49_9HYPH|nr:hypothetical protein [Methylobacterium gnaphalii]GEP09635.1 hypothetical protein MGN01_14800 [Methylobacterium gnaphalii]GJD67777.1 hypothetical protein MMMDOFMJ_0694 [Methylobacterium gnaphalii]GLS50054.1 hypothetical protein GCM10007885_29060 [Methylobacterium gnaphalii]